MLSPPPSLLYCCKGGDDSSVIAFSFLVLLWRSWQHECCHLLLLFIWKEKGDNIAIGSSFLITKKATILRLFPPHCFVAKKVTTSVAFLSLVSPFSLYLKKKLAACFFGMLSWAPFKVRATRFFAFGFLKKEKKSIWLFTKVFVWICRIAMGRKRKLKKVYYDQEVQEQNVVASELATKKKCCYIIIRKWGTWSWWNKYPM